MAPPKSKLLPTAQPKQSNHFDVWNTSSTGHQRAENRLGGSTGWRQSRAMKLSYQFRNDGIGGKRISDMVGAGSKDWPEGAKAIITKEVKSKAMVGVKDMLMGKGNVLGTEEKLMAQREKEDERKEREKENHQRGVFDGLAIYINGSTHPLVSDHKLKQLLSENGARISIHLGRRSVTHVILGRPNSGGMGAGGGLAGGKLENEIKRVGGCGVKYVSVEWALDSVKAGKRLPETQFSNLKVAPHSQKSVYSIFKRSASTVSSKGAAQS